MYDTSPDNRTFLIGFGSNLPSPVGDPLATVTWAIESISERPKWIIQKSRYFSSPTFPPGDQKNFVNAALLVRCPLTPAEFLDLAHDLEKGCERKRRSRWAPRTLDVDILACDQQVLPCRTDVRHWMEMPPAQQEQEFPRTLLLPHPRMHQRGFVLLPLLDVAPDWVHPLTGLSVRDMANLLPETATRGVLPLEETAQGTAFIGDPDRSESSPDTAFDRR